MTSCSPWREKGVKEGPNEWKMASVKAKTNTKSSQIHPRGATMTGGARKVRGTEGGEKLEISKRNISFIFYFIGN
jgi:hypothetical protein